MGINCIFSSSTYESTPVLLPNPDPRKFELIRHCQIGTALVLEVKYHGCTNYEGRKILVYQRVTLQQLLAQGSIDPHFCDTTDKYSPFARFEPTDIGWNSAVDTAWML